MGRHLLARQQRHAVGCVDVAELAGPAAVPVRVGQPHEVDVPLVQGPVGAGVVEQHQPDVDGVEDRLGEAALLVDGVHGQGELGPLLGGLGVPGVDLLDAAGQRERDPGRDERHHQRPGQVDPAGAEVEHRRHAHQDQARDAGDHGAALAELAAQPQGGYDDHGDRGAAPVVEPGQAERDDVEHRDDGDRRARQPVPGHQERRGGEDQRQREPGGRPGPQRDRRAVDRAEQEVEAQEADEDALEHARIRVVGEQQPTTDLCCMLAHAVSPHEVSPPHGVHPRATGWHGGRRTAWAKSRVRSRPVDPAAPPVSCTREANRASADAAPVRRTAAAGPVGPGAPPRRHRDGRQRALGQGARAPPDRRPRAGRALAVRRGRGRHRDRRARPSRRTPSRPRTGRAPPTR